MTAPSITIRNYHPEDESGWVRCRALAFLDTAYFDNVYQKKEHYDSESIELVASHRNQIVGLLDVECENEPNTICSPTSGLEPHLAGMIWHIAVHPDFRRQGIGASLLQKSTEIAQEMGIKRFEAWTRDDEWVESWYRNQGFEQVRSYYHVYIKPNEMKTSKLAVNIPQMRIQSAYAHYSGDDRSVINQFTRVHRCSRYDLQL
jgi:ribosomal protein S18 acetylase RimI-like enzyme